MNYDIASAYDQYNDYRHDIATRDHECEAWLDSLQTGYWLESVFAWLDCVNTTGKYPGTPSHNERIDWIF